MRKIQSAIVGFMERAILELSVSREAEKGELRELSFGLYLWGLRVYWIYYWADEYKIRPYSVKS